MVLGKYHARGKISSLNSLWRHRWRQHKEKKMEVDSVGNRFWSATENKICCILNDIISKNTGTSTICSEIPHGLLHSKEYDIDFENRSTSDLNLLLKEFYINLRQQNGELYTKNSFLVSRQSLNRYLRSHHVFKTFNFIDGQEFNEANTAFQSTCKQMREQGKSKVHHKPTIQKGDMQKLHSHPRGFNTDIPSGLLNKVFLRSCLTSAEEVWKMWERWNPVILRLALMITGRGSFTR